MAKGDVKNLHRVNDAHITAISDETVCITEKNESGKGTVEVFVEGDAIKIIHNGKPPLSWSVPQKCADGAVIQIADGECHVHIFELKKKITTSSWGNIKKQFLGMIFNSKAVLSVLDCGEIKKVTCYVCFQEDALGQAGLTNSVLLKTLTGQPASSSPISDWFAQSIIIDSFRDIGLSKVKIDSETCLGKAVLQ